jgi:hypothetical protein
MQSTRIATITLKTTMPREVARFWRELLGYRVAPNHSDSVMLVGEANEPVLLIQPSAREPEPGAIHLDLRPLDLAECRARALSLGATEPDIGQTGDEGWIVMADPAGNFFCVLQSEADHEARRRQDPGTPTTID